MNIRWASLYGAAVGVEEALEKSRRRTMKRVLGVKNRATYVGCSHEYSGGNGFARIGSSTASLARPFPRSFLTLFIVYIAIDHIHHTANRPPGWTRPWLPIRRSLNPISYRPDGLLMGNAVLSAVRGGANDGRLATYTTRRFRKALQKVLPMEQGS